MASVVSQCNISIQTSIIQGVLLQNNPTCTVFNKKSALTLVLNILNNRRILIFKLSQSLLKMVTFLISTILRTFQDFELTPLIIKIMYCIPNNKQ